MKKLIAALMVFAALPLVGRAEDTLAPIELTATIEAIDHDARAVTLKSKDGVTQTVSVGPEVKRFSELKVGDTVTFRYYESVAFSIRKPGDPASAPATGEPTIVRSQGAKPGGTVSKQEMATVTIKAIDAKVPSVTVLTADGRTASFRVDDPKKLQGVAVGDRVEITFTRALMVSVK
jgi:Cu/Ag efflux protein CusF